MKNDHKYTVGSLFAGIGGICLGFKKASFELKWANDNNSAACRTYRSNFRHPIVEGDIENLDPGQFESVDVLTAGFPCQAFSVAGYQKGFGDSRGNYFFETMRFINSLKPKAFLLENVRNLESHDHGNTIKVIRETILRSGYSFQSALLNTKDHGGIPQTRERIFIVGFRDEYPENSESQTCSKIFNFPSTIPLESTIQDILDEEVDYSKFYYDESFMNRNKKVIVEPNDYYKQLISQVKNPGTIYQWRRIYVRENKNGLCPTLTANMGTGGHNVPIIRDSIGIRKLTPRECARFQGFPDDFSLPGFDRIDNTVKQNSLGQLYKQIGNSVSVPVVTRIALAIKDALDHKYSN